MSAQNSPGNRVGFIGVGEIAGAMIEGIAQGAHPYRRIVLSPRGEATVTELTGRFAGLAVADDNQGVVDAADVVVLAVRPPQVPAVLAELVFRPGQTLVSAAAEVPLSSLRELVGDGVAVVRSIPLPPVSRRGSPTVIHPDDAAARELFELLGGTLVVDDEAALPAFFTITGTFSGYLQYLRTVIDYAAGKGVPADVAERFVRSSFASISPGLLDPDRSLDDLIHGHETPGGLNEQFRRDAFDAQGTGHLTGALDALHARVSRG